MENRMECCKSCGGDLCIGKECPVYPRCFGRNEEEENSKK